MMRSRQPTKALSTRVLALCLAGLLPTQGILSCGPSPARPGASLSRVFSSKSELDFDRANNTSSNVQEGGGWSNDVSNNSEGSTKVEDLPPGTPFVMDMGNGQKLVFDGNTYEVIGGDALVLRGNTNDLNNGVPVGSGSQEGPGFVAIPGGNGGGSPSLVERNEGSGENGGAGSGYAPRFPLNPANLTKRSEVLADIAKRLSEKEATLERREKEFETQSSAASGKGTAGGVLRGEADAAHERHSRAANDIGDAIDALGGGAGASVGSSGQGNTFKGLPGDGLPGSLGARLSEKHREAQSLGTTGVNPRNADFARHAQDAYARAAGKGREGLLTNAEGDERQGDLLKRLAGTRPDVLPPLFPEGPIPEDSEGNRVTKTPAQARGEALRTGLGLLDAAGILDASGLAAVASKARSAANTLFEVSLGIARVSGLLDVPLSVMELTGVTPTLDDHGNLAFREATNLEIAFAMAALGAAGVAFAAGGWTAAVGAGAIGGLTKAASKGLGARLALREAEAIVEEAAKNASKVVARLDGESVKALERALRKSMPAAGIERRMRQIIDAFVPGTIERVIVPVGEPLIVIRFFDTPDAKFASWVTPDTFSSVEEARSKLAVLDSWSKMSNKAIFQLNPGSEIFIGRAAAQGPYPGGGRQIYVPDPESVFVEVFQ